jgi:hypothetical protein
MVYCFPFLAPLFLLSSPSVGISSPVLASFFIYSMIIHRPCIQCFILFLLTGFLLCYSLNYLCIFENAGRSSSQLCAS